MGTIKRNFYNNITPTGKFDSADLTGTIPADNIANASLTNVTSVPASVGDFVQKVASDPTPVGAGDVWYNTTSNALKSLVTLEAWSSGSAMTSALQGLAGAGTQTSGLAIGGQTPPAGPAVATTNEYNGSGWSTGGDLNTARRLLGGAGTQTAALAFGGYLNLTNSESYDGSTWTATNALTTGLHGIAGSGTQTAGLSAGGAPQETNTMEFDGTSWTAGNGLNTGRSYLTMSGTQTSSLAIGGQTPTADAATEQYNGTSWTSVNPLNTARLGLGSGGENDSQAVAFTGATPSYTDVTETWDGTNWTTSPVTVANSRQYVGSTGSATAALLFGGRNPPGIYFSATEEYNKSTNVITAAAFSSGGTASESSWGRNFSNMGTQNATYMNAGYNGSYKNETEEYNGTSWSGSGASTNYRYFGTGAGTQTSGLAFGGYLPPPTGATNLTEEYNGSSWTSGGNMNTTAGGRMGGGPQTAAIACGGTGPITATEYYDGSTWTTQPATLNETHRERNGVGTQSSFVAMGGTNPAETVFYTDVEEYNGTSWSSVAELVIESKNAGGIMGQSADSAVYVGGQNSNPAINISNSQVYDGVSVVTGVNPAHSARSGNQGAGTSSAGGLVSGRYPGVSGVTEEFTGETSAINIVEITTS